MALFCGLTRRSVFLSKLAVYFVGLLCMLSAAVVVPVTVIFIVNGFGMEMTIEGCMEVLAQVIFFRLVSSAMGGSFIFLALATKSTVETIGAGLRLL